MKPENDLFAAPQPQSAPTPPEGPRLMNRAERRRVYDQWVADGSPWPPPPGLVSSCLEAAMRKPGSNRGYSR